MGNCQYDVTCITAAERKIFKVITQTQLIIKYNIYNIMRADEIQYK